MKISDFMLEYEKFCPKELDIKGMQDRISVKWLPVEVEEESVVK